MILLWFSALVMILRFAYVLALLAIFLEHGIGWGWWLVAAVVTVGSVSVRGKGNGHAA